MLYRVPERRPPWAKELFSELLPFYLPAVLVGTAFDLHHHESLWFMFFRACELFNWFVLKDLNDDDDRWKRRKKKAVETIEKVGGRLKVVAVSVAPSPA